MTDNFWTNDHTVHHDWSPSAAIGKFAAAAQSDVVTADLELTVKASALEMAKAMKAAADELKLNPVLKSDRYDYISIASPHFIAYLTTDQRSSRQGTADFDTEDQGVLFKKNLQVFRFVMTGDPDILEKLATMVSSKFEQTKYATIKWWHDSAQGPTYRTMYLENPNTVLHSEFYPGLTTSPEEYIENYLKSKASVLLMAGPAGTGKTTLLRHMIYKHNMCASVVYDENLMMSDSVFQTFLFDRENDVLIIEDADLIITSRQDDNNKLMSRFLNISDGLIKLPNKKLIFTTNISDFGRVDSALMRPGRCFDVMHTRHLSYEEAKKAAKVAGVTVPTEEREYTLAEVFSQKKWQEKRRVGFGFAA